jgi:dipeptidyl aminopeptidase/acylaminoacyl peptidase
MTRHPITVEDLWALPRVGTPAPAPDGAFVVVPVTTYDMETNEGATRLWRVPTGGGDARVLTTADVSSAHPAVSPDGTRLAFTRRPGGKAAPKGKPTKTGQVRFPDQPQLYVMALDGGEPERLTDLPLGVTGPRWFADGRRLAFLAPVYRDAPAVDATAERLAAREEDPVKARVTEDRVYRYWDHWLTDGLVQHVFAIDLETRRMMDLTPTLAGWMPFMEQSGHYAIAPDGREIALTAQRSEPPYDPLVWGVFTAAVPEAIGADAVAGELLLLTADHPAHAFRPLYSPDGRWLVYGIQRELDFYADRQRIVAYDRLGHAHTVLTEDWDVMNASEWAFGDDPAVVFFTAETAGRNALFCLDVPSATADAARRTPRELVRGGWFGEVRPAGGRLFATREALDRPPEVVSVALDGSDLRYHTDFTGPGLAGLALGTVGELTFTGAEGDTVQMFLVYPPDVPEVAPGATDPPKLPLVHLVHGGPHGVFGDQWHWRWNAQALAAPGHLVAMVNFHGSTGWGQAFAASILGRWGDQPFADIMAATDTLIDRGLVDPARMAATGGSYGGYLVSWIAGHTDRFACLVNHAGVSDFQTQYASDVTQGRARSMGGELWDRIDGLDRYNPIRHAAGFRSPMLVVHGEQDYRVPYDQGIAIYNVYQAMHLPARLVCYPDENHWILKPRNSRLWYSEVLGWLDRWLGRPA